MCEFNETHYETKSNTIEEYQVFNSFKFVSFSFNFKLWFSLSKAEIH